MAATLGKYADQPYIHIRLSGDHSEIRGVARRCLGTPVESAGRDPDGVFAAWEWDGAALTARTDRYGFYPLYYFTGPGEVCVSPSIPQLLAEGAPVEIDAPAMAVFLRLGFFLDADTPFTKIRRLPPGASFHWDRSGVTVADCRPRLAPQEAARDEAIDRYIALFRTAIRKRLPQSEAAALPLSGGRDSRHILLELWAAGVRPCCLTVRPRNSNEDDIAAQIARALDLRHVFFNPPWTVEAELAKNLDTSLSTLEHTWMLPMADYLRREATTTYDGIAGDVLSAGLFLDAELAAEYQRGKPAAFADRLLDRVAYADKSLAIMLRPAEYRRFGRGIARDRLLAEVHRHADDPNPVRSFFFWNRTRRVVATAPFGILAGVAAVHAPYLDHDVYDFLASLPPRIFLDHTFHTEAIARAFPRLAHIPYPAKRGFSPCADFSALARQLFAYLALRRRTRFVRRSAVLPRVLRGCIRRYSASALWLEPTAVFLTQLEDLCERPPAFCNGGPPRG